MIYMEMVFASSGIIETLVCLIEYTMHLQEQHLVAS